MKQVVFEKYELNVSPECSRQQYLIKVMIQDLAIGHLEKRYAELLGESLEQTDFEIGCPIKLDAKIIVLNRLCGIGMPSKT